MNSRILQWDSDFFECSVARLDIDDNCRLDDLKSFCSGQHPFDVCYVFDHSSDGKFDGLLTSYGAILYDNKITFRKTLYPKDACPNPDVVELTTPTPEAITLAVASGINSRYYLDQRFRSKQPTLYERWIMNCFENRNSKVLGIYRSGILAAIAGVSYVDKCGHLELIAVAPEYRRLGMAKKLIGAAENFYIGNGSSFAEVVTQKNNLPACATYSACGYGLKDHVAVWHFWKNGLQNKDQKN